MIARLLIFYNYGQQSRDSDHASLEYYDVYMGMKKIIFLWVSISGTGTLWVDSDFLIKYSHTFTFHNSSEHFWCQKAICGVGYILEMIKIISHSPEEFKIYKI